jgi:hypothetical protein
MFKRSVTLIEGVIAVGIFAFTCVAAIMVLSAAAGLNAQSADVDRAVVLAEQVVMRTVSGYDEADKYYDGEWNEINGAEGARFAMRVEMRAADREQSLALREFERYIGDDAPFLDYSVMTVFEPFAVTVEDLERGVLLVRFEAVRYAEGGFDD